MNILHLDENHPVLAENLSKLGCINHFDYSSTKEEILSEIHKYDGLVIRSRFTLDSDFLDKATNLKFIARVGAGLENIDINHAYKHRIEVIAAPEGNSNAVGEHALAMILSLFNKLKQADLQIRNGQWNREENRGLELAGKTVGIIGYGNMGKSFAKKLSGFDNVEVICYDIKDNVGDKYAQQVSLLEFQAKAQIVSLHTPLNNISHNMVNINFMSQFSNPFYLINTARGSAVVTKDLIAAMYTNVVLGACLDVLEYEKSSFESVFETKDDDTFSKLLESDKVLLSPHVAGWTLESKKKLATTITDKISKTFF